jgi:ERCC4-type nuclease
LTNNQHHITSHDTTLFGHSAQPNHSDFRVRFVYLPLGIASIGNRMTSKDCAKRKAVHHPSEVIDLVDDSSDTEDEVMHLLVDDKGREVIDLVKEREDVDEPPLRKIVLPWWEVVLLVDDREPVAFFNQLSQAGVRCERRRLATFDFLWVARRCSATNTTASIGEDDGNVDDFVLGYACERKEINDLAHSLNNKSKSTGLVRNVYQKLKMRNSGVEHKFYLVQGNIKDLYKTAHMQWDFAMGKRVHENIKAMERDDYTVVKFAQDAVTHIVDFLRQTHRHVELQVANKKPPDTYMTLTVMIERADWATELGVARKSLPRGALGEKKLQLILSEFPTSFKTDYDRDSAAMVQRLASLETDKRKGVTKSTAEALCTNLFGVVTEHATKGASVPVTPEASR